MLKTTYYNLPIYEPTDNASLIDGYNECIIELDKVLHRFDLRLQMLENFVAKNSK